MSNVLSPNAGGVLAQPSNASEFKDQTVYDPVPPSAISEQLDMTEIYEPVENSLRGRKWDFNAKCYVTPKGAKPLLSDEGIEDVMRWLRSYIHKGIFLSNLNEEDVCNIMRRICFSIIYRLAANFTVWKIQKSNLDPVMDLIEHNIFCAIKRPFGEGDRKFIGGMQRMHVTESRNQAVDPGRRQGSILGKVFRRGY